MASIAFIRAFIMIQDKAAVFAHTETRCPVCEFCGLEPGKVAVNSTVKEIRYCECLQCGARFKAIGEIAVKFTEPKTTPTKQPYKEKVSKTKKGQKTNGNRSRTNGRAGAI